MYSTEEDIWLFNNIECINFFLYDLGHGLSSILHSRTILL